MEYGPIDEIVPRLTRETGEFVVMGCHREEILRWGAGAGKRLHDSERLYGEARFLIEQEELFITRALRFPEYARPITEQT
jgi:hypothetical protein